MRVCVVVYRLHVRVRGEHITCVCEVACAHARERTCTHHQRQTHDRQSPYLQRVGGGARFLGVANLVFKDCYLADNSGSDYGGGVSVAAGGVSMTACRFVDNYSAHGGGMYIELATALEIVGVDFQVSVKVHLRCWPVCRGNTLCIHARIPTQIETHVLVQMSQTHSTP